MSETQRPIRNAAFWKGFLPERAIVMARKGALQSAESTAEVNPALRAEANAIEVTLAPAPLTALQQISKELDGCTRCKLCRGRQSIVVGEGNPLAQLVFVGEAPGEQEDMEGLPIVGHAGELLDKMILAMGLTRDEVYICNVVKCRSPGNRDPEPDEISACSPFLERQLDTIRPKVIVALGMLAAQTLLKTEDPLSRLRGQFHSYRGIRLMPTFHPAYLLRNPDSKREAWSDLQAVARELGISLPSKPQKKG